MQDVRALHNEFGKLQGVLNSVAISRERLQIHPIADTSYWVKSIRSQYKSESQ